MRPTAFFNRRKRFVRYGEITTRITAAVDGRAPVAVEPRPTPRSLEQRIEAARLTAHNFRALAAKASRPVTQGIMERDAMFREAKAAELERLRRGRQCVGELFSQDRPK